MGHVHRFGGGGGFVEEGGIGDFEAGEIGDHGLEIEEGFEAALGDLGLVRGVLGVPTGVLEDVALDDRGSDASVVSHADEGAEDLVLGGDGLEIGEDLRFGAGGGQLKGAGEADIPRDRSVNEAFDVREAENVEHAADFFRIRPDMAVSKGISSGRDGVVAGRCVLWLSLSGELVTSRSLGH